MSLLPFANAPGASGGSGTVTSVAVATANGFSGTVANATTTPAITIIAGAITPSSVNGLTLTGVANGFTIAGGTTSKTLTVPLDASVSGTNTGDQTITLTGDVTGAGTGSFATTIKNNVTLGGNPITTTQASTDNSTRIATTAYVTTGINNAISGVNPAIAVQVATTGASDTSGLTYSNGVAGVGATLTGSVNTALAFDGVTLTSVGQRVLVKNDTQAPSGAYNGVYSLTQLQTGVLPPILTRAADYNSSSDINNTGSIPVVSGTANNLTSWLLTSSVTTVGTDPLTYSQFTYSPATVIAPAGLNKQVQYNDNGVRGADANFIWDKTNYRLGISTPSPVQKLEIGQGHLRFNSVADAGTFTATANGAGVLTGQYIYKITYVTQYGETSGTTVQTAALSSNQVHLASIPVSSSSEVTSRNIYRSVSGGTSSSLYLLGSIADNSTTTYDDNAADTALGVSNSAFKPNTTAGQIYLGSSLVGQALPTITSWGVSAFGNNPTGGYNVGMGGSAGLYLTSGQYNTFFGPSAGIYFNSGSYNLILGAVSGNNYKYGSSSSILGTGGGAFIPTSTMTATAANGAGLTDATTYYYRVSYTVDGNETELSTYRPTAGVTTASPNDQVSLASIPTMATSVSPMTCTNRKIYRTKAGDPYSSPNQMTYYLLTTIADNTTTTYTDSTADSALGAAATGISNIITVGRGALASYTSQMVVGNITYPITDIYLGSGVFGGTPGDITIHGTGGLGTNNAGASLNIMGGKATGSATSGSIKLYSQTTGTSGGIEQATGGLMMQVAPDNKLGFYAATPVAQPTGDVVTGLSNLGLVSSGLVDTTVANTFESQSAIVHSLVLPTSTNFAVMNLLEISSSYTIEIPSTSSLEIQYVQGSVVQSTSLQNPYKFSVYRNAGWTASNGTQAKVSFDAATFDTGSNFDLVTNHRFVAPIAGFYWFSASVNSTLTAANAALIAFNKNSSPIKVGSWFVQGAATTTGGANISGILQLSINDYIEVFYTGSGGAGGTGANNTWFDGFLVSTT